MILDRPTSAALPRRSLGRGITGVPGENERAPGAIDAGRARGALRPRSRDAALHGTDRSRQDHDCPRSGAAALRRRVCGDGAGRTAAAPDDQPRFGVLGGGAFRKSAQSGRGGVPVERCGLICLVALTAPSAAVRDKARTVLGPNRYIEIYVKAPLDVCRARDQEGVYAQADAGTIAEFPVSPLPTILRQRRSRARDRCVDGRGLHRPRHGAAAVARSDCRVT